MFIHVSITHRYISKCSQYFIKAISYLYLLMSIHVSQTHRYVSNNINNAVHKNQERVTINTAHV